MDKITIKPGDIFCTENPESLGKIITWFSAFNSVDGEAHKSHAGILLNDNGDTFEAVIPRITNGNIFTDYAGKNILIARHRKMSGERFETGYNYVYKKYNGTVYPALRLPLMGLFPRLAKYLYWGRVVCSELAFCFLHNCRLILNRPTGAELVVKMTGLDTIGLVKFWKGVTPDNVEDAIRNWRDFFIVYEGVVPEQK